MHYNPSRLTRHHKKCSSRGGGNQSENIAWVPRRKHEFYHAMFDNKNPEEIAQELNRSWIDPAYKLICVRRERSDK